MKNYYKILGVKVASTDIEIKQAYRTLAKALHPDVNPDNKNAESQLAEVNLAYGVLSDSVKRKEYNGKLNDFIAQRNARIINSGNMQQNAFNNQRQPIRNNNFNPQSANNLNDQIMRMATMNQTVESNRAFIEAQQNAAYNEGYQKGFNDCKSRSDDIINSLSSEVESLKLKLKGALRETSVADKELQEQADRIVEIVSENEKLTIKAKNEIKEELEEEYKKSVSQIQFELNVANTHLERIREKVKNSEQNIYTKQLENEMLIKQNEELQLKISEYEDFVQDIDKNEDIERIIIEREKKLKVDKKQLKNTCYGALGVMYWASKDEIEGNYNKLKKRYLSKLEAGDHKANQKIDDIEKAYKILSIDEDRQQYNLTLEVTDEDIQNEITLEEQYNSIIEKHNKEQSDLEFWQYVDDLMMLAQTGDAEAQNTLGELYYFGDEMVKDLEQALYWFKEGAKQQYPSALFNLGCCFYNGEGADKDMVKGAGFIKQAAKLGCKEAVHYFEP